MDILLIVLHGLFFTPIFWRVATRVASGTKRARKSAVAGWRVLAQQARLVLMLHATGLVLLYAGLLLALARGAVARSITVRGVVGASVLALAVLLMAWASYVLRSWRLLPKVDAGHELCTTGPYSFVRHPMYLAIDLLALGTSVWIPTPSVWFGAILLIGGGDLRARAEKNVLLDAFGGRYREYMQRVRRTVPGVY